MWVMWSKRAHFCQASTKAPGLARLGGLVILIQSEIAQEQFDCYETYRDIHDGVLLRLAILFL